MHGQQNVKNVADDYLDIKLCADLNLHSFYLLVIRQ